MCVRACVRACKCVLHIRKLHNSDILHLSKDMIYELMNINLAEAHDHKSLKANIGLYAMHVYRMPYITFTGLISYFRKIPIL